MRDCVKQIEFTQHKVAPILTTGTDRGRESSHSVCGRPQCVARRVSVRALLTGRRCPDLPKSGRLSRVATRGGGEGSARRAPPKQVRRLESVTNLDVTSGGGCSKHARQRHIVQIVRGSVNERQDHGDIIRPDLRISMQPVVWCLGRLDAWR